MKTDGSKITKTRSFLIRILTKDHLPVTELELRKKLRALGLAVNKTTVYRELAHLKNRGLVREIDFGDRKKRYELNSNDHHHLICTKCHQIEEIYLEDDVGSIEKIINQRKNFWVKDHLLEFFGVCNNCVTN